MSTYIILSRISPQAMDEPKDIKELAARVNERVKKDCPSVVWKESYAVTGSWDIVDIIESEKEEEVEKAAMIIRSLGHADTQTLSTTPWHEFLERM